MSRFRLWCFSALAMAIFLAGCSSLEGIRQKGTSVEVKSERTELPPQRYVLVIKDAYGFRFTKGTPTLSREHRYDLTVTQLHPDAVGGVTYRVEFGQESVIPGTTTSNTDLGYLGRRVGANLTDGYEELTGTVIEMGIDNLGQWTRENFRQQVQTYPLSVREVRAVVIDLLVGLMIPVPSGPLTNTYHWQTQTELPINSPENRFTGEADRSIVVDSVKGPESLRRAYLSYSVKITGQLSEQGVMSVSNSPQITTVTSEGKGSLVIDAASGMALRADGSIAWRYTVAQSDRNDDSQWDGTCTQTHSFSITPAE